MSTAHHNPPNLPSTVPCHYVYDVPRHGFGNLCALVAYWLCAAQADIDDVRRGIPRLCTCAHTHVQKSSLVRTRCIMCSRSAAAVAYTAGGTSRIVWKRRNYVTPGTFFAPRKILRVTKYQPKKIHSASFALSNTTQATLLSLPTPGAYRP